MSFMIWIIEELENGEEFFYDAYQVVKDWWPPFDYLKYPLYGLYGVFKWLVEGFYEFYQWLDWAEGRLDDILTWLNLRNLIRGWLVGIEDAIDWFFNWTTWVGQYIADWWPGILPYILTYIDNAVEGLGDLVEIWDTFWTITFPNWTTELLRVGSELSDFFTTILPTLVNFSWLNTWWQSTLLDIDALIRSWTTSLQPFWEGWQEIRDSVFEFFADPLKWLYDRVEDFLDRYW